MTSHEKLNCRDEQIPEINEKVWPTKGHAIAWIICFMSVIAIFTLGFAALITGVEMYLRIAFPFVILAIVAGIFGPEEKEDRL